MTSAGCAVLTALRTGAPLPPPGGPAAAARLLRTAIAAAFPHPPGPMAPWCAADASRERWQRPAPQPPADAAAAREARHVALAALSVQLVACCERGSGSGSGGSGSGRAAAFCDDGCAAALRCVLPELFGACERHSARHVSSDFVTAAAAAVIDAPLPCCVRSALVDALRSAPPLPPPASASLRSFVAAASSVCVTGADACSLGVAAADAAAKACGGRSDAIGLPPGLPRPPRRRGPPPASLVAMFAAHGVSEPPPPPVSSATAAARAAAAAAWAPCLLSAAASAARHAPSCGRSALRDVAEAAAEAAEDADAATLRAALRTAAARPAPPRPDGDDDAAAFAAAAAAVVASMLAERSCAAAEASAPPPPALPPARTTHRPPSLPRGSDDTSDAVAEAVRLSLVPGAAGAAVFAGAGAPLASVAWRACGGRGTTCDHIPQPGEPAMQLLATMFWASPDGCDSLSAAPPPARPALARAISARAPPSLLRHDPIPPSEAARLLTELLRGCGPSLLSAFALGDAFGLACSRSSRPLREAGIRAAAAAASEPTASDAACVACAAALARLAEPPPQQQQPPPPPPPPPPHHAAGTDALADDAVAALAAVELRSRCGPASAHIWASIDACLERGALAPHAASAVASMACASLRGWLYIDGAALLVLPPPPCRAPLPPMLPRALLRCGATAGSGGGGGNATADTDDVSRSALVDAMLTAATHPACLRASLRLDDSDGDGGGDEEMDDPPRKNGGAGSGGGASPPRAPAWARRAACLLPVCASVADAASCSPPRARAVATAAALFSRLASHARRPPLPLPLASLSDASLVAALADAAGACPCAAAASLAAPRPRPPRFPLATALLCAEASQRLASRGVAGCGFDLVKLCSAACASLIALRPPGLAVSEKAAAALRKAVASPPVAGANGRKGGGGGGGGTSSVDDAPEWESFEASLRSSLPPQPPADDGDENAGARAAAVSLLADVFASLSRHNASTPTHQTAAADSLPSVSHLASVVVPPPLFSAVLQATLNVSHPGFGSGVFSRARADAPAAPACSAALFFLHLRASEGTGCAAPHARLARSLLRSSAAALEGGAAAGGGPGAPAAAASGRLLLLLLADGGRSSAVCHADDAEAEVASAVEALVGTASRPGLLARPDLELRRGAPTPAAKGAKAAAAAAAAGDADAAAGDAKRAPHPPAADGGCGGDDDEDEEEEEERACAASLAAASLNALLSDSGVDDLSAPPGGGPIEWGPSPQHAARVVASLLCAGAAAFRPCRRHAADWPRVLASLCFAAAAANAPPPPPLPPPDVFDHVDVEEAGGDGPDSQPLPEPLYLAPLRSPAVLAQLVAAVTSALRRCAAACAALPPPPRPLRPAAHRHRYAAAAAAATAAAAADSEEEGGGGGDEAEEEEEEEAEGEGDGAADAGPRAPSFPPISPALATASAAAALQPHAFRLAMCGAAAGVASHRLCRLTASADAFATSAAALRASWGDACGPDVPPAVAPLVALGDYADSAVQPRADGATPTARKHAKRRGTKRRRPALVAKGTATPGGGAGAGVAKGEAAAAGAAAAAAAAAPQPPPLRRGRSGNEYIDACGEAGDFTDLKDFIVAKKGRDYAALLRKGGHTAKGGLPGRRRGGGEKAVAEEEEAEAEDGDWRAALAAD